MCCDIYKVRLLLLIFVFVKLTRYNYYVYGIAMYSVE